MDWHRLVMSGKADLCEIEACDLGLEVSVKQYAGRVDVVVHDGVVASMVQVVEPFSGTNGDAPPRRPVQNPPLCTQLGGSAGLCSHW